MLARTCLVVVALELVACGGGASSSGGLPAGGGNNTAQIDAIVNGIYPAPWGVEVAMFKRGRPLYVHGYGLRDRGLPDRFGTDDFWGISQPDKVLHLPRGRFAPDELTEFDLASVSKEFTAGAILLLQQDHKLSVNDPLSKYFPRLPQAAHSKLLYLLQHSSGFVDYNTFGVYPDFSGAYASFMASGQTNYDAIVRQLAQFPLQFAPGTKYAYSNTNYLLLGMIVQRVSGLPLGEFMQQRIFGPLGMTRTQQGYPAPPVTDLALGYAAYSDVVYRTWQWNLTWLAGPGGLTSTVDDLEKWDEAVRNPGIFSAESLKQMFTPGPFPQSFGTYADGWIVSALDGHPFIWHDGNVGGYLTVNATFPRDDINIVILTNDWTGQNPYNLIPQLFPIALRM